MFLLSLPETVWVEVLVYWTDLKQIGRLDSACCTTVYRQRLLHGFQLDYFSVSQSKECSLSYLNWLYLRGLCLQHLLLTKSVPDRILMNNFTKVMAIDIYQFNSMTIKQQCFLIHVVQSTKSLHHLNMSRKGCFLDAEKLNFNEISSKLKQLKSFIMQDDSHMINWSKSSLLSLLKDCSKLESFIYQRDVEELQYTDFEPILLSNPNLSHVKIDHTGDVVSFDMVKMVYSSCINLTKLELNCACDIDFSILCELFSTCKKLSFLHLNYDDPHSEDSNQISYLWNKSGRKIDIDMSALDEDVDTSKHILPLMTFFQTHKEWTAVTFDGVDLTDDIVATVADNNFKTLKEFSLIVCSDYTTRSLTYVLQKCRKLRTLCLNCCGHISTKQLVQMFEVSNPKLKCFEIGDQDKLLVRDILEIIKYCPKLDSLIYSQCKSVNDEFLQKRLKKGDFKKNIAYHVEELCKDDFLRYPGDI